jgi:hypothetical protein
VPERQLLETANRFLLETLTFKGGGLAINQVKVAIQSIQQDRLDLVVSMLRRVGLWRYANETN